MLATLLHFLVLFSPGQFIEEMVDDVVDEKYERVAVVPRPVYRPGMNRPPVLGGDLGPQADYFADRLTSEIARVGDGEFEIVESARMREVCRRYTLSQLNTAAVRKLIAENAGDADVLIIPVVTNKPSPGRQLDIRCVMVDVRRSSEEEYGVEELQISLSDAAYMGESWELRRWSPDGRELLNVGLLDQGVNPRSSLFGTGPRMEQRQYQWIDRKRSHPLASSSDFFGGIEVRVGGETRPLQQIGDDVYVALNAGEEPVITVSNRGSRDVYSLLLIDGINVLGKKREHPGDVIARDHFRLLKPDKNFAYEGWYTQKSGKEWQVESFQLTDARQSVAGESGFTDRLGLITCVFFTVGWEGVPPGDRFLEGGARLGFGAGRSRPVTLEPSAADAPGLIMAAVTLKYARSDEISALKSKSTP